MHLILFILCGFAAIACVTVTGFIGALGFHMFKQTEPKWIGWFVFGLFSASITVSIIWVLMNTTFPGSEAGIDYNLEFRNMLTKTLVFTGAPGTSVFLSGFLIYIVNIFRRERAEVLTRRGYRR